jgi:TRAP-type C4-dicarboxylate transport system substrate-binding protein
MWDGWWFLVNRRAWERVPRDLQEVVSRNLNAAAMAEREEVAKQNDSLKGELAAKGLVFNDVDPQPFREVLRKSGFYLEWKQKFGNEAWSLLEEATGNLA